MQRTCEVKKEKNHRLDQKVRQRIARQENTAAGKTQIDKQQGTRANRGKKHSESVMSNNGKTRAREGRKKQRDSQRRKKY